MLLMNLIMVKALFQLSIFFYVACLDPSNKKAWISDDLFFMIEFFVFNY